MNNLEWLMKNDRDAFIDSWIGAFNSAACDYCTEDNNTCESPGDKYCEEHVHQWLEAEHMDNIRTDKDMSICPDDDLPATRNFLVQLCKAVEEANHVQPVEDDESCVQQSPESCNLGNSGSIDLPSILSTDSREKLEDDIINSGHTVAERIYIRQILDRQAAITRSDCDEHMTKVRNDLEGEIARLTRELEMCEDSNEYHSREHGDEVEENAKLTDERDYWKAKAEMYRDKAIDYACIYKYRDCEADCSAFGPKCQPVMDEVDL